MHKYFIWDTSKGVLYQCGLTPIPGKGYSGYCLPGEILCLEMEQIPYVWNSAHLPRCLQALLNMAQVLASMFPIELQSGF